MSKEISFKHISALIIRKLFHNSWKRQLSWSTCGVGALLMLNSWLCSEREGGGRKGIVVRFETILSRGYREKI